MLSDSPRYSTYRSSRNRIVNATTNKRWSDRQKIEAVTTYFMLGGNLSLVGKQLKIPYYTLKDWKETQWWRDLETDIRKEERLTLSTKLKNVMDLSLEKVRDRLEHGDWIYDQKAGELRRKPVNLRDTGKIMMDAANLRIKMDIQENHTVAQEHIGAKLEKLALAFSNLSKGIPMGLNEVQDVEFVEQVSPATDEEIKKDAVHEERETGLQDREPEVQQQTGTEA